jgi:hypothetical protein
VTCHFILAPSRNYKTKAKKQKKKTKNRKSFFFHSILEIDRSAEQQATYCVVLYAFQFPLHTLGVAHEYGEYGVELTPPFFFLVNCH